MVFNGIRKTSIGSASMIPRTLVVVSFVAWQRNSDCNGFFSESLMIHSLYLAGEAPSELTLLMTSAREARAVSPTSLVPFSESLFGVIRIRRWRCQLSRHE